MKLTDEEKKMILAKRIEDDKNTPKKTGRLKHDLIYLDIRGGSIDTDVSDIINKYGYYIPEIEIDKIIERFRNQLKSATIIETDTPFDCYIDCNQEQWYDSIGEGIEGMDAEWAKLHLTDIKKYKS